MHSIINIENNIVLLLYNINITTRAIISKYISRKHAVHFKLTQCYLSYLFNTKNFLKRIHDNPLNLVNYKDRQQCRKIIHKQNEKLKKETETLKKYKQKFYSWKIQWLNWQAQRRAPKADTTMQKKESATWTIWKLKFYTVWGAKEKSEKKKKKKKAYRKYGA